MYNYRDFESIKTIKNFNEIINEFNETHFHDICCYNSSNLEVIKYCVKNGADFNIKNTAETTPFDWICKFNEYLIKICKPYINEYDYVKTLKEYDLNWKEYV